MFGLFRKKKNIINEDTEINIITKPKFEDNLNLSEWLIGDTLNITYYLLNDKNPSYKGCISGDIKSISIETQEIVVKFSFGLCVVNLNDDENLESIVNLSGQINIIHYQHGPYWNNVNYDYRIIQKQIEKNKEKALEFIKSNAKKMEIFKLRQEYNQLSDKIINVVFNTNLAEDIDIDNDCQIAGLREAITESNKLIDKLK